MATAPDDARGVPAGVLRRIAVTVIVVGGVGMALLDRDAGANAVFAAIFVVIVYGTLVAVPIQILYRDIRLRPAGAAVFAVTVLAILGAFWCVPLVHDQFSDDTSYVVAVRAATGRGPLAADAVQPWQMAALACGAVVILGCVTLSVITWHLQRHLRGRAVNPAMTRSVLATFATLPEPSGGTSVTRPAPAPGTGGPRRG